MPRARRPAATPARAAGCQVDSTPGSAISVTSARHRSADSVVPNSRPRSCMTAARTAADAGGPFTNASRNAPVRSRRLLKTAARTQRSVPSRRAMAASASVMRGSFAAPSASATCSRTRASPSSASRSTASINRREPGIRRSASRSAFSRTLASGSRRPRMMSSSSSTPRTSIVQSACRRPSSPPAAASARSRGAADCSRRSMSRRCAVSRHHALGCSRFDTSAETGAPAMFTTVRAGGRFAAATR